MNRLILIAITISLPISAMASRLLSNKIVKTDTLVNFLSKKIATHENIKQSDISVTTIQITGTSLDNKNAAMFIEATFKYLPSIKPMRKELLDKINKEGVNACKGKAVEYQGYNVNINLDHPNHSFRVSKIWGTGCKRR